MIMYRLANVKIGVQLTCPQTPLDQNFWMLLFYAAFLDYKGYGWMKLDLKIP